MSATQREALPLVQSGEAKVSANSRPLVSVVLCTSNVREPRLTRVIEALREQSLPATSWELLLVQSSGEPLRIEPIDLSWHPCARTLRKPLPGKTGAFLRGAAEAAAPLLVTVDEHTVLAPDYLQQAVAIGAAFPQVGVWSGNVSLEFEQAPPEWVRPYRSFLGEQLVLADATECSCEVPGPMPGVNGCCVRKEVVQRYAFKFANSPWRQALDPTATASVRGEQADLVLTACEMGLHRGLFQSLNLTRLVSSAEFEEQHLVRLVEESHLGIFIREMSRTPAFRPPVVNLSWWLKVYLGCLGRWGWKRRMFLAAKRAQKRARRLYELLTRIDSDCPLQI